MSVYGGRYNSVRKSGVSDAVVIDAEDTDHADVVVLVSYVAHQIERPLGLKRKNNIFDCSALLHKDIADVIIPFHIHTGADALSSFYGHGKPSAFESAMKSQKALKLLSGLGKSLPVYLKLRKTWKSLPPSMFTRIRQVKPSLKPVPKSRMQ